MGDSRGRPVRSLSDLPDVSHCLECGNGPLEVFYENYDDENGVVERWAHCDHCLCDWQWLEYYYGCENTGRTIADRTPLSRKWWG